MNQLNLKTCSNKELFNALKSLRSTECEVIAEIVRYLAEVDQRQVYRDYGYSSLFTFCTEGLGYSEGAAQRRIVAARSLNKRPEVYQLLQEGELSLCALAEVARVMTPENGAEVLQSAQGLGKLEAQRLAAQYQPEVKPKRETVRARKVVVEKPSLPGAEAKFTSPVAVIEERFSLSFEISARGKELLEDAKRYSRKVKVGELFELLLEDYVSRKRPKVAAIEKVEKPVQEAPLPPQEQPQSRILVNSRYIPRAVRDTVRLRDGERCSFVAPDGTRCCETMRLQFDHITPFAQGGGRVPENLRLVCPAHNQLYAERIFGSEFMARKRKTMNVT